MLATQALMRSQANPSGAASASDDARLLAASREGSVEAFEELVRRHQNLVCAIAYSKTGDRRLSEDVAQDTFLAAWTQRETIREPDRLRSWLCSTARNLASKARRVGHREQPSELEALERDAQHEPSPLDRVIDRETEATVWEALAALPETYREPLVLFYRENRSIRQVAVGLGLSEDATKKRLSRGRQALREGVHDRVERTLEAGRPRATFTAGVLALLGTVALPQSAAAAQAASATPTGAASGTAGGGGKLLWLGLAAVGLIASVLGIAMLRQPTSDSEPTPVDLPGAAGADAEILAVLHQRRRSAASERAVAECEFHGTVLDDHGDPVEGAMVAIGSQAMRGLDPSAIRVRDDGTWSFGPVPPGQHAISVTAPGHLPATAVGHCDDDTTPVIETRLSPGGVRLRGSVEDIAGGVVADATVWLVPAVDPTGGTVSTRSNDDGVYDLSVRPDRYTVVVAHPDYVLDGRVVVVSGDAAEEDFRMLPAATIEGTVVDDRGNPVAHARLSPQVSVSSMSRQTSIFGALFGSMVPMRSDDDGRFRIGGLSSGEVKIHASTPSLASREPATVHLAMAESKSGLTIQVAEAFAVSGFVVDEADPTTGLAGTRVILLPEGILRVPGAATTDQTGYFEVRGLSPGDYRVAVNGSAVAPQRLEQRVHVSDGDLHDVLFRARRGVEIRGRVDPPGRVAVRLEPVHGGSQPVDLAAQTLAAMAPAETTDTGEFRFPAVADGQYVIVAATLHHEGRTAVTVDGPPTSDVVIEMTPLATIEGTVVDDAGHPVAGVVVSASPQANGANAGPVAMLPVTDRTDHDGRFEILGARPTTYALSVLDDHGTRPWADPEDGRAFAARTVDVGRESGPFQLAVATGTTTVDGRVVDQSGSPVADARVQIRAMGASAMSYLRPPTIALTDDDGNFSFEGLFGESFMVKAVGPHGALYSKPTLAEGKETVTLSLAPISSLHATVEHDGEPVENFEVDVTGGPSPVASSMVRKRNGAFEIPNLISGEYAVTVRAGQRYAREVVQVGPRPRTRVQLEVLPAPRIRGRVVDENGDPGTQAQFMLMPDNMSFFDPSWEFEREPVQADGSFEVRDMLAGRWTAMIRATDGSTKTFMLFEFDLDPGQELDLGTLVLGTRLPLSEAPFLDRSPDLGIRFFVGPTPPDPEALDRVDQAADPRSVIETEGASLWIAQVEPDSPAEQAGLQAGDAVLAVGRTEVGMDRPPLEEMISLSRRWRSAGRPVDWTIERGGARQVLSVLVPSASSDGP